jgi:Hsp20/alpha crystallin family
LKSTIIIFYHRNLRTRPPCSLKSSVGVFFSHLIFIQLANSLLPDLKSNDYPTKVAQISLFGPSISTCGSIRRLPFICGPLSFPCLSSSLSFSADSSAFANIGWKETPDAHVFKADLPGIKEGVEVEEDKILQINGERTRENEKIDTWHRVGRCSGLRGFKLAEYAKIDQIKAAVEIFG